jgi:hypothetical protein
MDPSDGSHHHHRKVLPPELLSFPELHSVGRTDNNSGGERERNGLSTGKGSHHQRNRSLDVG